MDPQFIEVVEGLKAYGHNATLTHEGDNNIIQVEGSAMRWEINSKGIATIMAAKDPTACLASLMRQTTLDS